MARRVVYAKAHTTTHLKGIGELPTVFPPTSKVIPGFRMELGVFGVRMFSSSQVWEIPFVNFQVIELDPEEDKPAAAKKAA